MKNRNWTKNELILAFNFYLRPPFGKTCSRNNEIIQLEKLINRTSDAVVLRLSNFAHIDPFHQAGGVKGLEDGAKKCQPIWNVFVKNYS
jgi:putative restriction endonuclease